MFTIKTATGKEFDSTYVANAPNIPYLYVTIVGAPFEEVVSTLLKRGELPFEGYEGFGQISGFDKLGDNETKLILKP